MAPDLIFSDNLVAAECFADPPHPPWYVDHDPDSYGAICPTCQYQTLMAEHAPCEHRRHWRFQSWKITHRLELWAYAAGIVAGGGVTYSTHCRGCVTSVRWGGHRPYILFAQDAWWSCLLRRRHLHTGGRHARGLCGKCAPCPDCGSTTAGDYGECLDCGGLS